MSEYHQNKELSYLMYCDANSVYRWAISQKVTIDGNKQRNNKFNIEKKFEEILWWRQ